MLDDYSKLLNDRTRLVAVGCASNAAGTINPVKRICQWASDVGAMSFLDAVHYAPHDLIDVSDWGCDFLICSAYKFFGPHVGIMYGRRELLEGLQPYKLRPSPDELPGRWMTGTQNFECIAGTQAAIDYLASIGRLDGKDRDRRAALVEAFSMIRRYERTLVDRLLDGLASLRSIQVWGITKPEEREQRFPTVSITHAGMTAEALAKHLAEAGIFCWHGNYYALPLTERLGVEPDGMVRIGLAHYNTPAEVDRLLRELAGIDQKV
jgi:cysteine desulfurase family protein (TIGR01976 family)